MISLSSLRAWPAALGKLVSHLASRVSFFDSAGMDRPAGTSAAGAAGARAAASASVRPAVMMFRIVRVIGVLNHIPCPKLGHPATKRPGQTVLTSARAGGSRNGGL